MHPHPTAVGEALSQHRAEEQLEGGSSALALGRQGTVLDQLLCKTLHLCLDDPPNPLGNVICPPHMKNYELFWHLQRLFSFLGSSTISVVL